MKLSQLLTESALNANLKQLYQDFNRKYFDGALPEIPVKWNRRKNTGGIVKAKRYRDTGVIEIQSLEISNQLELSQDELYGLLLHEMIHVYVMYVLKKFHTSGRDKSHGIEFTQKLRELQKKVSFEIPETEMDVTNTKPSENVKAKPTGVILRHKPDGRTSVMAITEKALKTNLSEIQDTMKRIEEYSDDKTEIFITSSKSISKIPVKRKWDKYSVKFYFLSDEDIKDILQNRQDI